MFFLSFSFVLTVSLDCPFLIAPSYSLAFIYILKKDNFNSHLCFVYVTYLFLICLSSIIYFFIQMTVCWPIFLFRCKLTDFPVYVVKQYTGTLLPLPFIKSIGWITYGNYSLWDSCNKKECLGWKKSSVTDVVCYN